MTLVSIIEKRDSGQNHNSSRVFCPELVKAKINATPQKIGEFHLRTILMTNLNGLFNINTSKMQEDNLLDWTVSIITGPARRCPYITDVITLYILHKDVHSYWNAILIAARELAKRRTKVLTSMFYLNRYSLRILTTFHFFKENKTTMIWLLTGK